MADQNGGETIKQMLAGFNSMQMQLGLLPQNTGQQPMGIQLNQPPPPPMMPHPSEFAMQVSQQQQMMMQQTVQAAQMTRYQPPPSSPPQGGGGMGFTWGNSFAAMSSAQFNPQIANAMGGGMGVGMPNPIYSTAPQFGMYRPQGPAGGMMSPMALRPPPIFNPMAPQLPAPHFMTPAMQSYQVMQARQAESLGMTGAMLEGGLGIGGSLIGGALGSAFGPLGSMAGSWLGGKVGGAVSNMTIGPAFDDIRRGRQLQNMTAPWMVGGPNLNPFTGQGLNRGAATDLAHQLRTLTRDHEFSRTGFNTQDVMKITQLASDQGLLQTAQNPDEIARKVKDISKSIKALVQITGDPDVRNAIAHLGQMRQLGFEGLGGQMGAVANRAAFARMAGVSQAAMHEQFGMPGAMMAQSMGLAGATGYGAGVGGAGLANLAVHGGALSDLSLSRVGGKQGLSQLMAQAELGAINNDVMMMASMNAGGKGVNIEDYRRAQQMGLSGAVNEGANRMGRLSAGQMTAFARNRQEYADRLAQQMSPVERQMNMIRQVQMMRKEHSDWSVGDAFQVLMNPQNPDDPQNRANARALEQVFTSGEFYTSAQQQLRVQRREAGDRERARREQFRTPGFLTNVGRGTRDLLGGASDFIVNPVSGLMERSQRIDERIMAQERGERLDYNDASSLIRTPQDQALALEGMRSRQMRDFSKMGADPFAGGGDVVNNGRSLNRMGRFFGLSEYSDANYATLLANRAKGGFLGISTSYGDAGKARDALKDIGVAARGVKAGQEMTGMKAATVMENLQKRGDSMGGGMGNLTARSFVTQATRRLMSALPKAGYAGLVQAGAASGEMFQKHAVDALVEGGMSREAAEAYFSSNKEDIMAMMSRDIYLSGDKKAIETLENAMDTVGRTGAFGGRKQREELDKNIAADLESIGLKEGVFGLSHKSMEQVKGLVKANDPNVLAYAAAKEALLSGNDMEKQRAGSVIARIEGSFDKSAKGQAALEELRGKASQVQSGASSDVKKALVGVVGAGGQGSSETTEARFAKARSQVGVQMAGQATSTALGRLEEETGVSGLRDKSLGEAISSLDEGQIGKIQNKELREAALAFKRGEKGGLQRLQSAVTRSGASGTQEIFGGGQGGTTGIDKQIADLEEMKQKLAKSDRPEDKTSTLFASSVEVFAQAAKDLKEATSDLALMRADRLGLAGGGR